MKHSLPLTFPRGPLHLSRTPVISQQCRTYAQTCRSSSTATRVVSPPTQPHTIITSTPASTPNPILPPLSILPTSFLLRSYFMAYILSSPRFLRLFMPLLHLIADSPSPFLNADHNPLIRFLVRKLIYEHFNAGETENEVRRTVTVTKAMGFKGVILGYAKEVNVSKGLKGVDAAGIASEDIDTQAVREWREGTLKTLSLIDKGDFLAVKLSGGGPSTLTALATGKPPSPAMWEAVLAVCEAASAQGTRIWTDAEQQDLQPTIDVWTLDLMRKYNKEKAMIYNTFQAYLKSTPENVLKHLRLAQEEGWVLGVKLVRGAYIATEERDLICNTIEDTHGQYNTIVKGLLSQDFDGVLRAQGKAYPKATLFLASHNKESVEFAYETQKALILSNKPTIEISYGQLQGMADELSCSLLQLCEDGENEKLKELRINAFKCLAWGTTQECLQFLLRRVKENGDALGRTGEWVDGFKREIWRRVRIAMRIG